MSEKNVCLSGKKFEEANLEYGTEIKVCNNITSLGTPIEIGMKRAENRLVCQAMEGCDGKADGSPDELTRRRYLRFARGGAGIIWFEATACLEEARANPRQLWLTRDNADSFKRLIDEIRETSLIENGYAPLIIMQNTHSGRHSKPNGKPEPIIAYNNPILEERVPVDPSCIISDEGIDRVKEAMVKNSVLAEEIGFDGVDIKCCHGYLNSELLSAFTRGNSRYGGSFDNRTRLLLETVKEIKEVCSSDFTVTTRMNAYDGYAYPYGFGMDKNGGNNPDLTEASEIIFRLKALGVSLVNISMGNPYFNPHINRPFANGAYEPSEHPIEGVKRVLSGIGRLKKENPKMLFISSALSWLGTVSPNVAAAYIENGDFDFAGYGRMTLAYPDFANDILKNGGLDPKRCCIACSKCTELMRGGSTPGCVIKDRFYTDLYREFKKNQEK